VISRARVARIVVGRIGCKVPAKLTANVGRFVIGDPVRVDCLNGRLRAIRYSPPTSAHTTSTTASGTTVSASPGATSSGSGTRCAEHTRLDENGQPQVVFITCTTRIN
jgi:hypothetical protein